MKVACCLRKSRYVNGENFRPTVPAYPPHPLFPGRTLFHVVTSANDAAGLSALIRGEEFTVKRAYD